MSREFRDEMIVGVPYSYDELFIALIPVFLLILVYILYRIIREEKRKSKYQF